MAAKSWDADFRYAAIRQSMKVVRNAKAGDIFCCPSSLCVPVANKPIVGWTPGRIMIIALVLGFALMFGGAVVVSMAEDANVRGNGNGNEAILTVLGAGLSLCGLSCFFLPVTMDRFVMKRLLGSRGAELALYPGKLLCAELSDADRSKMKISIDGDDYVLILADYENRRLLIEGVAARYLIRAEDVTDFCRFQFMNYVGAEITFRVGDEILLSVAIARVSLLLELTRQLPFLFFLQKRIKNRTFKVCAQRWILRKTLRLPRMSPEMRPAESLV